MVTPDTTSGSRPPVGGTSPVGGAPSPRSSIILTAALLAAMLVTIGSISFLTKGLPDQPGETLNFPAAGFTFAFGSGHPATDRMLVDGFANGYALLSSGPVSIQADELRVLSYTWLPPKMPQEAAFFWRRSDDTQNVLRTDITAPGTRLVNLAMEPDWQGEISEFGFLLAGINGEIVEIGATSLYPESLTSRLQLTWLAWSAFEKWSQQSINFIQGGDYRQVVALPLLVAAWLLITLILLWLFSRFGKSVDSRHLLITAGILFLVAWVLLDLRWAANNLRQIKLSLQTQWQADEQQRASIDLDGEINQYVHRLKNEVLGDQPVRIQIVGDENADDYYLLRAKYHLLPHSVAVSGHFDDKLLSGSLDYVIFFGQPGGIAKVPGWNPRWQQALTRIDSGDLGTVYRFE